MGSPILRLSLRPLLRIDRVGPIIARGGPKTIQLVLSEVNVAHKEVEGLVVAAPAVWRVLRKNSLEVFRYDVVKTAVTIVA